MRAVSAPTVVIIAAGEGTRMRSALPKVLHPLCGRPLILWPVTAAQEAGAGKVVVVDNPKRRLEDWLPEGVEIAVQPEPNGTGGAVAAAGEHIDADATVVVINGDVPLITPEAIKALVERPRGAAARPPRWPRWSSTTRPSTAACCATGEGNVERVVEAKARRATRRPSSSRSARSTPASTRSTAPISLAALQHIDSDNAQGELYLPDTLPKLREAGKTIAAHVVTDHTLTLGVNDRVELEQVRKLAQQRINEWHARNGVTIVDLDTAHIDVDVDIGRDTVIEPGHGPQGRHDDRRGLPDRPVHDDHRLPDRRRRLDPALLPGPGARRRLRHDRPVRLPAPRRPPAPERQGRRVRRDQELDDRQGDEGPAPVLHR